MPLRDDQIRRYARQLVMREFTGAAQERLLSSHVLVYGSGPASELCVLYLAGAGIGSVSMSSQGGPVEETVRRASALNPDCNTAVGPHGIRPDLIADISGDAGAAAARQIAGALKAGLPYIKALNAGGVGLVKLYRRPDICPGCLVNAAAFGQLDLVRPPEAFVLGPVVAAMAVCLLAGIGPAPEGALVLDTTAGRYEEMETRPVPGCLMCGCMAPLEPR